MGAQLIPVLTLVLKVDIHYAIRTSLVSVIATSSGAAAAYVKEGISNIRLGIFLELAATIEAIGGIFSSLCCHVFCSGNPWLIIGFLLGYLG